MRMPQTTKSFLAWVGLIAVVGLGASGCDQGQGDTTWETAVSAAGAKTGDQEAFDERWRSYREGVIAGLDEMTRSLASARKQATVADRGEADALTARVGGLRSDLLGEFDAPRSEANAYRAELESSFEALREDVESFLIRLGHSEEEFAPWRSAE